LQIAINLPKVQYNAKENTNEQAFTTNRPPVTNKPKETE
jgi:hypothetical protein